ncbi:MAG TPA: putative baseplate assembly protein, partial [Actinoplanes sp.]|nr:putative baseplate assembly protein [Actinoplanes sp.]
ASGLLPESVAIGARNPQDLSFPLALFGDAVTTRRAYLSATEAFSTAGALVRLRVRLARRGTGKPLLTWVYQAGDQWRPLGQSSAAQEAVNAGEVGFRDGTRGLTRDGELTCFAPRDWARTVHRTRSGHWLRIDVEGEGYTATPLIASLEADFDWVLPRLGRILIGGSPASTVLSHNDFQFVDHTAEAAVDTLFPPFIPTADNEPALYLGLDRPFDPQPTSVYLQVEPPRPEEVAADSLAERDPTRIPEVVWEYVSPTGWRSLRAVDGTRSLTGRGAVTFLAPEDLVARSCFGRSDYWLRARWTAGVFPVPPRLRRVLLNTTWAVHGETIADEVLGSSNGNPDLVFVAAQRPLQPGRQLRVREPEPPPEAEERALAALEGHGAVAVSRDAAGLLDEVWVRWHEVPDLYGSQPRDRHYTMDALTGEVRFGDGVHGMIPPPGQGNVRLSYRTGGGPLGNRGAGSVAQLRSAIPYVESVINHEPAIGGAAAEPIERYQDRGPRVLRHRNRAVAAQDLEDLAAAASPEVARVAAVVPRFNPFSLWRDAASPPGAEHLDVDAGRMGVVIVPNADDQRPTPSLDLLRRVKAYLEERCPVTADVWVAGPEWIAVAVTATVVPTSFASAEGLADRVRAALSRYLHPLTGGADGQGWVFGRKPQRSQLYALIEALEGVDHVDTLTLAREPATGDAERKLALQRLLDRPLSVTAQETEVERELRRWLDRALIYSGRHDIDVAWR